MPYIDSEGRARDAFTFTLRGVRKVFEDIKDLANFKNSNIQKCIDKTSDFEILYCGPEKGKGEYAEYSITIPLARYIRKDLGRMFNHIYDKLNLGRDAISPSLVLWWCKKDFWGNKRKEPYYFRWESQARCGQQYLDIITSEKTYESCPCPEDYKNLCKDITAIMGTHAIRDPNLEKSG